MGVPRVLPRVVVTHWVHPEVLAYLAAFSDPVAPTRDEGVWPPSTVASLAADADGLVVCMADRVDEDLLARCPQLRVVSATLKGYDNLDAEACARRGIWLTVVPDALIGPTAELAVGLTLGLLRRIVEGHERVRSGGFAGWRPSLYGSSLGGADVGIVGMGALGQAIARRLAGFDARLAYVDPQPLDDSPGLTRLDDVRQLVSRSDVIVAAVPLTAGTVHLIDADVLRAARPGAFLVNVGRGSVVDEEAVATALTEERLGGYAADVFAMEDWALDGHPRAIPAALLAQPSTLFTPHLGSAVDEVRLAMSMEAARQVRQVFDGERPDHPVASPAGWLAAGGGAGGGRLALMDRAPAFAADPATAAYYDRRAGEYDGWYLGEGLFADRDRPGWDDEVAQIVDLVEQLPAARTLDVACGTGFLTRHLQGYVVGMDQSPAMVAIAQSRLSDGLAFVGDALHLEVADGAFERILTGHFYGHLPTAERSQLLAEARRVAGELVVIDSAVRPGLEPEQHQERILNDGSRHQVYKRYFTGEQLAGELGGQVLFDGRWFVAARVRW